MRGRRNRLGACNTPAALTQVRKDWHGRLHLRNKGFGLQIPVRCAEAFFTRIQIKDEDLDALKQGGEIYIPFRISYFLDLGEESEFFDLNFPQGSIEPFTDLGG